MNSGDLLTLKKSILNISNYTCQNQISCCGADCSLDGTQGPTGPAGPQGATGAPGINGSAGSQGARGFQGSQGSQGAQGFQGAEGSQGPAAVGSNIYASYYSTVTQPIIGPDPSGTTFSYNSTFLENGISLVDNTKITVSKTGIYEAWYSLQASYAGGGTSQFLYIWLRKNGTNVPNSNGRIEVNSNNGDSLPIVPYIIDLNAGDYIEFIAEGTDGDFSALSVPGTPPTSGIPSIIVGIKEIASDIGTDGPQGSQGAQGAQGAQGEQGPQGSQGAQGIPGSGITLNGTDNYFLYKTSGTSTNTVGASSVNLIQADFTTTNKIIINGNLGIGIIPETALDVDSNLVRIRNNKTPASAADIGNKGEICWDSNYIYVCVATNTWKRTLINTWP
jgi:hypothetical protein